MQLALAQASLDQVKAGRVARARVNGRVPEASDRPAAIWAGPQVVDHCLHLVERSAEGPQPRAVGIADSLRHTGLDQLTQVATVATVGLALAQDLTAKGHPGRVRAAGQIARLIADHRQHIEQLALVGAVLGRAARAKGEHLPKNSEVGCPHGGRTHHKASSFSRQRFAGGLAIGKVLRLGEGLSGLPQIAGQRGNRLGAHVVASID